MSVRAALYLRQSTFREESISLELQEAACRRHCEERGYQVIMVEADPGISGRTFKRPAVQRVMDAVESGSADVVVLWKWSRLSRSRRDWAIAADRVDVAGGRIESATEDIDVSTSHGRLARGMMVEFAAFESERIGDQWREAHERRVAMGLPANGKPRFGYRVVDGLFEPDPETGPVLAETYRRYIAGESVYSLVKSLNDRGYTTVEGYKGSGGAWSERSLRRVLDSGFGAGLITANGRKLPGAHQALITDEEWADYQAARRRRSTMRGAERSVYLLSGLVRCACGSPMNAGQFGHNHTPKFRCRDAVSKRAHDGGYVTMSVLEDEVVCWMQDIVEDLTTAANSNLAIARTRSSTAATMERLNAKLTTTEKALTKLTVDYAAGRVPDVAYHAAQNELMATRETILEQIRDAESQDRIMPASLDSVRTLLDAWDLMPVALRREALRGLIRYIRVKPRYPRSKVTIIPTWFG